MSNQFFVGIINKEFEIPEDYILRMRKYLSKELKMPANKIFPDFILANVKSCLEWNIFTNESKELKGYLSERLYWNKKMSYEETLELKIETVLDYIYYSAILDGILEKPGDFKIIKKKAD
jgi:hypothetical protein